MYLLNTNMKILLVLIASILLLVSCIKSTNVTKKIEPNVYDGSMGVVLGCMFNPSKCESIKRAHEDEKSWKEVDK